MHVLCQNRDSDFLMQMVVDVVHACVDGFGMGVGFLHVGHGPSEEGHHVGVQSAHVFRSLAIVKILNVQIGGVVCVFLVHATFNGETRGQGNGSDETVFRVFQRIVRQMAV